MIEGSVTPLSPDAADGLVIAVPKGRILSELTPLMAAAGLEPEPAFFEPSERALRFATNMKGVEIIRVRSFDVATFVAFGAAHIGFAGSDVLMEFDYSEIYAPLDLGIGTCRLSIAVPEDGLKDDPASWSHIRVASKYPALTKAHFAARGVQAEIVKLNGAMELAPSLGLCRRIVDLVSTGSTLKANGLVEVEKIMDISTRLIVNRAALKTRPREIKPWIARFATALAEANGETGARAAG